LGTKAKLKDIQFRFISDADAMNNALKAGDIDAIGQVNGPEQLTAFQQDPNFTIVKGAPSGKFMVSINETSGALADKRVRQALYASIDREAWITGVGAAGVAVPIGSHSAPNDGEPYCTDILDAAIDADTLVVAVEPGQPVTRGYQIVQSARPVVENWHVQFVLADGRELARWSTTDAQLTAAPNQVAVPLGPPSSNYGLHFASHSRGSA
jgi:ABC-type transport system substrate-binding protein